MKIKLLLYLLLISQSSSANQPENDLTKISKQIQLTAEIKKNNRAFGNITFKSLSEPFQFLTWNSKTGKFSDTKLEFIASNTLPVGFNIHIQNPIYQCIFGQQIISLDPASLDTGSLATGLFTSNYQFRLDVKSKSRDFTDNTAAINTMGIKERNWEKKTDNTHYVYFSVNVAQPIINSTFLKNMLFAGHCSGSVTFMFSALPL